MDLHVTENNGRSSGPGPAWAEVLYHTVYLRPLNSSSVILDLGASLAFFSRDMNERFGCRCHAVEALPENFARIDGTSSITPHNLAICGTDGPISIHSVDEQYASASINLMPGQKSRDTIEGEGITLTGLMERLGLDRVSLLKVDIEGAELAMFDATDDETLLRMDQITVEFHDFMDPGQTPHVERIIERLQKLGFWSIRFTRRFHGDVLFINPQRTGMSRTGYLYARYFKRLTFGIRRKLGGYFSGQA